MIEMNETREGKVKSKEEKGIQNEKRTADELLEELADYLQNKEKVEKHIEAYSVEDDLHCLKEKAIYCFQRKREKHTSG